MNLVSLVGWIPALFLASTLFSHNVALRLALLMMAVVSCALALAHARSGFRILPPIWLPWLLWAAWAALSLLWSVEPDRSQKELQNEVLYTSLALIVCHIGAQAGGAARAFLSAMAIAAVLVCLSALYAFGQGVALYGWGVEFYDSGWHGGAGDHSATLLTLMPCALAVGWYAKQARWPRLVGWASGALLALFCVSAYSTGNRTIWVGFVLEILAFSAALLFRRSTDLRARLIIALAASTLVATAAGLMVHVHALREKAGIARSIEQDPRLAIWPQAAALIEQRPLTGYGFGRGLLRDRLPDQASDPVAWHAHNLFLDLGLQVGLPGLALFIALIGATLRRAWHFALDASDAAAACGMALAGVVIGMITRNMTDMLLVRQNSLLFWGVTGVLLAWGTRWRAAAGPEKK